MRDTIYTMILSFFLCVPCSAADLTESLHGKRPVHPSQPYQFVYADAQTQVTSPLGGINTVTFDSEKRMTSSAEESLDGQQVALTQYTYDAHGKPTRVTYPNQAVSETEYNDQGLVTIQRDYSNTPFELETQYTWTDHRLPQHIAYSNGLSLDFTYNQKSQVISVTKTGGSHSLTWHYTYDAWAQPLTLQTPYNDSNHPG